jgi:hypothetical protein
VSIETEQSQINFLIVSVLSQVEIFIDFLQIK